MIYEDKQIPELVKLKHRWDDNDQWVDYENNILNKSLSPHLYKNNLMSDFLNRLQKLVSMLYDQHNIIKNFKNYIVNKDYYKHSK